MELFRHDRKLYHWTGDDWIGSQITWDEIIRVIWQDLICHLSNILFHHIFWHKSASILRNTHWQNAKPLFLFLTRKGVVLYEQEVQGQKKCISYFILSPATILLDIHHFYHIQSKSSSSFIVAVNMFFFRLSRCFCNGCLGCWEWVDLEKRSPGKY